MRRTRSNSPSTPPSNSPSPSRGLPDASGIPRCIPLHGHLSTLSCPSCSHSLPITPYLEVLSSGTTLPCPSCQEIDDKRRIVGERSRGVGWMKPDVVLYGEAHPDGERVGAITRRDLMGPRPDLLIVVGTSLKVPGTKLLVRELAKVIKPVAREKEEVEEDSDAFPSCSAQSTSTVGGGRKRKPTPPKPKAVHTIYLNLEFPTPSREFKDVFDVWMKGDVQGFVEGVEEERRKEEEREKKKMVEKEERERKKVEKDLVGAGGGPAATKAKPKAAAAKPTTASKKLPATHQTTKAPSKKKYSVRSALHAKKTKTNAGAGATRSTSEPITAAAPVDTRYSSTRMRTATAKTIGGFAGFAVSKPGLMAGAK
ncbi:hypothetical protein P7C70_g8830, partial [Phenoliferia sp. Uapishka_3]